MLHYLHHWHSFNVFQLFLLLHPSRYHCLMLQYLHLHFFKCYHLLYSHGYHSAEHFDLTCHSNNIIWMWQELQPQPIFFLCTFVILFFPCSLLSLPLHCRHCHISLFLPHPMQVKGFAFA